MSPEEQDHLEALFETLPELGSVYHFREEWAEIFDTAPDRTTAERRIFQWQANLRECGEAEAWQPFLDTFDRHRDGILAYFDERKTSGVVEGLNNKARVIIKRCYGLKTVGTLWTRLLLDVNRLSERFVRTIPSIRQAAQGLQTYFCGVYT